MKGDKCMQMDQNPDERENGNPEENPDIKDSLPFGLGFSLGARSEEMENFAMMMPEERAIIEEQGRKQAAGEEALDTERAVEGVANFRILNNNQ